MQVNLFAAVLAGNELEIHDLGNSLLDEKSPACEALRTGRGEPAAAGLLIEN